MYKQPNTLGPMVLLFSLLAESRGHRRKCRPCECLERHSKKPCTKCKSAHYCLLLAQKTRTPDAPTEASVSIAYLVKPRSQKLKEFAGKMFESLCLAAVLEVKLKFRKTWQVRRFTNPLATKKLERRRRNLIRSIA